MVPSQRTIPEEYTRVAKFAAGRCRSGGTGTTSEAAGSMGAASIFSSCNMGSASVGGAQCATGPLIEIGTKKHLLCQGIPATAPAAEATP